MVIPTTPDETGLIELALLEWLEDNKACCPDSYGKGELVREPTTTRVGMGRTAVSYVSAAANELKRLRAALVTAQDLAEALRKRAEKAEEAERSARGDVRCTATDTTGERCKRPSGHGGPHALLSGREAAPSSVTKPSYYRRTIKGVEIDIIDVVDAFKLPFTVGNAIKYLVRAGQKPGAPALEDLAKAREYVERETAFRQAEKDKAF